MSARIDEHGDPIKSQDESEYQNAAKDVFADKPLTQAQSLGAKLAAEFQRAMTDRQTVEQRWLQDLRQFKGEYEPSELAKMGDRSKAYVRKTRVKVKTADSRMADLLFPNGSEKNWSIKPTPKPTLPDNIMIELQAKAMVQAKNTGATATEVMEELVRQYACKAAAEMERTIEDQLKETKYRNVCKDVLHSGNLYGTGVLKGPLLDVRVRSSYEPVKPKPGKKHKWKIKYTSYPTPGISYVSLWNFYPDMSAVKLEGCRFVYELHTMTQADMAKLAKRKTFNGQAIINHLRANPKGMQVMRSFTEELRSKDEIGFRHDSYTWDVLERHGWLTGEELCDLGMKVPQENCHDVYFCNVWLLPSGEVLKCRLHGVAGESAWPYHIYYYEKEEDSIFGSGLAEIMRDDQKMINAGVRMMLDNGAFSAGPIFELDENLLATGEATKTIAPWQVFRRRVAVANSNQNGQAVRVHQTSPNLDGLGRIVGMFDQNADEVTAIPRYMTGENVKQGAAGTASGMSMLMGAANIVLKDLLSNWDNGVAQPLIEGFYHWNMTYNPDTDIKGDFSVDARGASSMIAKEVRAQQLINFLQLTNNPEDKVLVNRRKAMRELANCLEMRDVMNTDQEIEAQVNSPEAQQQAQLMQMQQQLAMAELQGRANKLMAEAERAAAQAKEVEANIQLVAERVVAERVQQMFASVQAAQGILSQPGVALAADQVFRSAGGKDQVQLQAQQQQKLGMELLESAVKQPDGAEQPQGTNTPQQAAPQQAQTQQAHAAPQSATLGAGAGSRTARDDTA